MTSADNGSSGAGSSAVSRYSELPYLTVLKSLMQKANALPISPLYAAVSKAVQDNAFAAITGSKPVETALSDMPKAIDAARAQ